jgi:HTH-type transcriptional regulator/antitoxin HigA
MKTKILKTEQAYNEAFKRVYRLIHSTENAIEPYSVEGEEIELLSLLIEKYEQETHHFPFAPGQTQ